MFYGATKLGMMRIKLIALTTALENLLVYTSSLFTKAHFLAKKKMVEWHLVLISLTIVLSIKSPFIVISQGLGLGLDLYLFYPFILFLVFMVFWYLWYFGL